MPSLKREMLLSDVELHRLIERDTIDKRTRATNDARVRKKFTAWLRSVGYIMKILDSLPEDQIRDVTKDVDIYALLCIIEDLLKIRKFHPIEGEDDKPDDWQIVIDENTRKPASDSDVARSSWLGIYRDRINEFYGSKNPVGIVELLARFDSHPQYRDRVTDGERESIKRVQRACAEFEKEMGWAPSDAPK